MDMRVVSNFIEYYIHHFDWSESHTGI